MTDYDDDEESWEDDEGEDEETDSIIDALAHGEDIEVIEDEDDEETDEDEDDEIETVTSRFQKS